MKFIDVLAMVQDPFINISIAEHVEIACNIDVQVVRSIYSKEFLNTEVVAIYTDEGRDAPLCIELYYPEEQDVY